MQKKTKGRGEKRQMLGVRCSYVAAQHSVCNRVLAPSQAVQAS